jgi:hypothetical protein
MVEGTMSAAQCVVELEDQRGHAVLWGCLPNAAPPAANLRLEGEVTKRRYSRMGRYVRHVSGSTECFLLAFLRLNVLLNLVTTPLATKQREMEVYMGYRPIHHPDHPVLAVFGLYSNGIGFQVACMGLVGTSHIPLVVE